jgi:hypothetical protein
MRVPGCRRYFNWMLRIPRLSYGLLMLPMMRMILLGGVLIATLGLAAGFSAPDGSRAKHSGIEAPARGPLIAHTEHPEWRQFLVLAAIRRAHELEQLMELPGQRTAVEPTPDTGQTAGLPALPKEAEPDDATGSITDKAVNDVIPIDIGESSATELPIGPPATTPVIEPPKRIQLPDQSSVKPADKPRRAKARVRRSGTPARAAKKTKNTKQTETNSFFSLFDPSPK